MSEADFTCERNIVYKTTADNRPLMINLYRPKTTIRSILLFAHGGGFSHGSRKAKRAQDLALKLASEGVVVASFDYRLKTELDAFSSDAQRAIEAAQARTKRVGLKINPNYCGPRFYAALEDMSDAVGFLRDEKNGPLGPGIVPLLALGVSAGGIAALSLAHPPRDGWENLNKPDAAISVCGAMVQPWRLKRDGPPLLIFHGYHDGVISPKNARVIDGKAKFKHAPVEVIITDVRGHKHQVPHFINDNDPEGRPWLDKARKMMKLI